ncbi:MAG: phosphoadenosine phosphosulfate reductase [Bacteroidetes bacterium RIFOXYA12_FULL_35_11]|nr:MAG: phosphoadenosine phosphosulfate reductase [Bacteroidetes bacterium GWF2_35_48]OFY74625.1 MAG: phosphoadenosine phosphosulfate reductase [Bacteroidetes bacterium RIFOXYA12_FULL_35_11]OFY95156.1 MAG: phosphoadenosine phosphosulfate reductase [Bacteroidetes bacterium RIFOXYB2_FULL_35_7]HBX52724.1 phosphoadenylyl-sulfate reductase [Bacteroidales bacterium]
MNSDIVNQIFNETRGFSIEEHLLYLIRVFKNEIVFSTSFGFEDQVITDLIFKNNIPIEIFTIDTGRLFPETYRVFNATREKYKQNIRVFYPEAESLEKFVTEKGPNSFYESLENRKECCFLRKVVPLQRALKGKKCWITGLRAEQSENRQQLSMYSYDALYDIIKFNPLLEWTFDEVKNYIQTNNIPYNSLHDKNFVSIGCEPCTRAIKDGEDFRAGRWWWEQSSGKECGLHT